MPKETTKQTRRNTAAKKTKSGPKRGLSAYMCFCKEQRANVIKENPNASFGKEKDDAFFCLIAGGSANEIFFFLPGEIGKKLGEKWKKMTDEEKAVSSYANPTLEQFGAHRFLVRSLTSKWPMKTRSAMKPKSMKRKRPKRTTPRKKRRKRLLKNKPRHRS